MPDRSELAPRRISRDKLALFLPNQELIRAFEILLSDVSLVGQKLEDLEVRDARASAALNEALASILEPAPLPADVDELRERIAHLESALQIDYSSSMAALREEVATMAGNKRKRVFRNTVTMSGTSSADVIFSPPVADLALADLRFLGCGVDSNNNPATCHLAAVDTVRLERDRAVGVARISYEITEYYP